MVTHKYITRKIGNLWYSTDTLPRKNGNFGTAAEKYQWYRVRGWSNTKILGSVHVRRLVHYQKQMVTLVKQKYITKKNGNFWYSTDTLPKILVTFGKARKHYQK